MNSALRLVESPAWSVAGWTMLHYLWIGAALGIVAWLLRRAVRPLSPPVRYAVALATFAALAVAPAAIAWRVAAHAGSAQGPNPSAVSVAAIETTLPESSPPLRQALAPPLEQLPLTSPPPPATSPPIETVEAFLLRHATASLDAAVRWAPLVWLLGMPLVLALLAAGLIGAERLRQRSAPLADGPIADAARRWAEALRITRSVAVGVTDCVVAPLVIGVVRPMIVLPASIVTRQSPEQMEMILLHELAHVRRADNLVNLVQRVVEALLFFQPAVWIVSRWVRLEREHCCDMVVLSYTGDPQGYAETLASLAMPGIRPAYAAAAMANHQLVSRIQHILRPEEQVMSLSPKAAALAGAICLAIGLSLAAAAQQADAVEDSAAAVVDDAKANQGDARFSLLGADSPVDGAVEFGVLDAGDLDAGDAVETGEYLGEIVWKDGRAILADMSTSMTTSSGRRAWGPEQATGAPNVANAAHDTRAWASMTKDDQDEWLELRYAEPVEVAAVQIFANCNPGAVSRVTVFDAKTVGLQYTWQGKDPVKAGGEKARGVSIISVPVAMTTDRVRIELASKAVAGWNEIDAVGLLDASGKTHWASEATASSTLADRNGRAAWANRLQYRNAIAKLQTNVQWEDATVSLLESPHLQRKSAKAARPWSPEQATGAPSGWNSRAHAADDDGASSWQPSRADGEVEQLSAHFDPPVKGALLLIYETGNPAVTGALVAGEDGRLRAAVANRDVRGATPGEVITRPLSGDSVKTVTLTLDTAAVPGYSGIDAVGVIDAEGNVHWADRAAASSTRADVVQRAKDGPIGKYLEDWGYRHHDHATDAYDTTINSCLKCHDVQSKMQSKLDEGAARAVSVGELLAKSDDELREWLKSRGAANVRIAEDGKLVVEGHPEGISFGTTEDGGRTASDVGSGAKAVGPELKTESKQPAGQQGASYGGYGDAYRTSGSIVERQASETADFNRIAEDERAFRAQVETANAASNAAAAAEQQLLDWRLAAASQRPKEQVQLVLTVGRRGHFARPRQKIVRAELVDEPDRKNVLSVTITGGGLEFVANEPGGGVVRCWDTNGTMIEVSVMVRNDPHAPPPDPPPTGSLRSLPRAATPETGTGDAPADPGAESKPLPDAGDASQNDARTATDRLVAGLLGKARVANRNVDGRTLARRWYLDLLGVPPTAEQIERFVGDGRPETLEKSLQELLRRAGDGNATHAYWAEAMRGVATPNNSTPAPAAVPDYSPPPPAAPR